MAVPIDERDYLGPRRLCNSDADILDAIIQHGPIRRCVLLDISGYCASMTDRALTRLRRSGLAEGGSLGWRITERGRIALALFRARGVIVRKRRRSGHEAALSRLSVAMSSR